MQQRGEVLLETVGVTVRFGGLVAVDDASITVERGSITALIGPNGAGKSTLLNAISGFERPRSGQVLLRGEDLVGVPPNRTVHRGMARTFQDLEVFGRLTVAENVALALPDQTSDSIFGLFARPRKVRRERQQLRADVAEILARLGLAEHADELAENLSYGMQKQVILGRLLATRAELLMLDEPGAGLPRATVRELGELLRKIVPEEGKTVLLIDHNMDLVLEFADYVHVLHAGRVITSGTPAEIREDDRVLDVYLSRTDRSGVTG